MNATTAASESGSVGTAPLPPSRGLRARLAARLSNRPDTEHEMSRNRLVFALLIAVYTVVLADAAAGPILAVLGVYFCLAFGVVAHLLARPGISQPRRAVALALDMAFLSAVLHLGGETLALFYFIYLWVILGNGFRFGIPWLRASMAAGLLAFGAVVLSTEFWWNQIHLSIGLWLGMLIVPGYAGTLIRKLEQARRQAEQANEAKTLFLASVSHELRTPLTAIIGMGGLLAETRLEPAQQEMTRTIGSAAKSLLGLIDGILDFSRIEAGDVRVETVEFELLDLLDEVRRLVAVAAAEKGLVLALHVTPRTPLRLRGDRRHLQEILTNLAGNAVKFTAAGSVVLAADLAAPEAGGRLMLRFEVSDTGIGIAPEATERVFESFTQADASILNRFGGTGLGLAICRRLVELHGGRIGVESQPGIGSTFFFTFALEAAEATEAGPPLPGGLRVLLLAGERGTELEDRLAALGVGCRRLGSVAEAVALLRGAARPAADAAEEQRILLLDPRGLGAEPQALATTLHGLAAGGASASGAASGLRIVLVDEAAAQPGAELPRALAVRRDFVTVVPPAPEADTLRRALRIARGAATAAAEAARAAEPLRGPARPLHVLVADDNRVNRRVVERILQSAGHSCQLVSNGEEALDALESGAFDLVVMDLNMPVMDGIEAVKLYRMMALGQRHVPVIGLTADATPEATARCLEAGMDACVIKPVEPQRLLEVIESVSGSRADAAGAEAPPGASAADGTPAAQEAARWDAAAPAVTEIASHPRFRPAGSPLAVDENTLADLEALGGADFLAGLIDDFLAEAEGLVRDLANAVAEGDTARFRQQSHALGSGASNIGARGLGELCRAGQQMRAAEIAARGPSHIQRLQIELERVGRALAPYRSGAVPGEAGGSGQPG
ncbi:hypothetical protein GCM10010964_16800 [Caldovatus sediminis]|uniref:histidine kinase n=1 Tax=Caldovatus sediminis TaxID=2041189 RepID=A0A8J2ZAD1_9PROT|nr:hybrid sensor histidine kinase/response regulator [Caldovatus sediminis]GGG29572.1 hypothetical protein GCM10010964_16800 [Caldovatus sediminis]